MWAAILLVALAADPISLAVEDIKNAPNPQTTRYVWVQTKDVYDHAMIDWVSNTVMSTATTQAPTVPVADGQLVRIDLSSFTKDEQELATLLNNWERFTEDEPYFQWRTATVLIDCPPYVHTDGKTYSKRHVKQTKFGSYLPFDEAESLTSLTLSSVPVVEYRWFCKKLLTTTEGGLYYQFRGIPGTQAEFLQKFGGVTEEEVANLRSDQKYAVFFSNVTAKPRGVLVFRGLGGRTAVNQGLIFITQDISDDDNTPDKHPFLNLIDNQFTATEIIMELPNGFHVFGLFDGDGNRQDAAPDNVVKDHEVPRPYTAKLQGAISCIRCHASHDGIKPVENDMHSLLASYIGETKKPFDLDRAYGLYAASLDKPFNRARDDYSDAVVLLGSRYNLPERLSVAKISNHTAERFAEYRYTRVYAEDVLKEFDVVVFNHQNPEQMLQELAPSPNELYLEDPRILALKRGIGINRSEYEIIYPILASRIRNKK